MLVGGAVDTALMFGFSVENDRPAKCIEYDNRDLLFYPFTSEAYIEQQTLGSLDVKLNGRAYLDWIDTPFCRRCETTGCAEGLVCRRRHGLLGRNLLADNRLLLALRKS